MANPNAKEKDVPGWDMYLGILILVGVSYGAVMYLSGRLEGQAQMGATLPGSKASFVAADITTFLQRLNASNSGLYLLYLVAESFFVGLSSLSLSSLVAAVAGPLGMIERRLDTKVKIQLKDSPQISTKVHAFSHPVSIVHYLPFGLALLQAIENFFLGLCTGQHLMGFESFLPLISQIISWIHSFKGSCFKFFFTGTFVTIGMSLFRIFLQGLKMGNIWEGFRPLSPQTIPGLLPASNLIGSEKKLKEIAKEELDKEKMH